MIINIRGTSGSGKSTLVRRIMDLHQKRTPVLEMHRRQPIAYELWNSERAGMLAVIGHYETACGGCDTITQMDETFRWVRYFDYKGYDVIFEGLLISADVNRTASLHEDGRKLLVVALDKVPIEECLASVNKRRLERLGPEKFTPVKEKNTRSKHRGVETSMRRLLDQGVECHSCDREEAFTLITDRLGLYP